MSEYFLRTNDRNPENRRVYIATQGYLHVRQVVFGPPVRTPIVLEVLSLDVHMRLFTFIINEQKQRTVP